MRKLMPLIAFVLLACASQAQADSFEDCIQRESVHRREEACMAVAASPNATLEQLKYVYGTLCKLAADKPNLNDAFLFCGKADEIKSVPELHVNLGSALYAYGRYNEARAQFTEALNINPSLSVAHFNLGRALEMLGKKEQALEEYREALYLHEPMAREAYNDLSAKKTVAVASPKQ